uniref:KIAA1614 n=1 Tax=Equus caballus TaxID=9796 RepID=A0A3Q2HMK5_HORSE
MEVTSAVERSDPEPQPDNGHLPRPWPCPQEDRTCSLMAPQPSRAWGIQFQGPSVLESKVRALKEKMTAGKQGASPCLTSHERPSPKKAKARRVKVGRAKTPSEGSSLPDAVVVHHAQNLTDGQLDSSVNEEEPAGNGGPRLSKSPAPGLECWNRRSRWPPEAVGTLPDRERSLLPGPGSLQDSPMHRVTPGQPRDPGPCNKITHMPRLRKGRSYPLQDGLVTGGDLDSLSLTCKEDFVPRPGLLGGLWRAGDLGALGPGYSALSLSDRVEKNRLLLQEMLSVGGQGLPKVGIPAWTPSWDRAVPERPAGDVDWDSGISLQDSDQNRDGHRSPALGPRMTFACRDNLQNGNTSDSSSGESPKRGTSPSHVRFEDESARDAESRYLERLQQRQRHVLSSALQTVDQGPLRSKPELAAYVNGGFQRRDAVEGALRRPVGGRDRRALPAPQPARGRERRCRACGNCIEDRRPAQGKAAPDPRAHQERKAACGTERVLAEPLSARGRSAPIRLLPVPPGLHAKWIRETHIGAPVRPEEVDSALDSTDTSDSCRTDSEEAGTSQPDRTRSPARGSSPRLPGSRPREGHRWFRKAEMELPRCPQAPHCLPGVDPLEVSDEGKEGRAHTPEGTLFPREDAFSKPPVLESKRTSLGSQGQPGPELGNHWAHPVASRAQYRTVCATASCMKLVSSGPGRQAQVLESHRSLETVSASSQQQSHAEPSAPHQAEQPTASCSPKGWVPTPPSSRKTTSPVSHRKAALAGPRRPGDQGQPADTPVPPSRSVVPRTCELSPLQTQPCSPQVRHALLALSTNNCNNSVPRGLQEPQEGAVREGRVEKGPRSQEPEAPLENHADGGLQGFLGSAAAGTISSKGVTLSLASEEPESSQEPEGGLQRTELNSGGHASSRALPGVSAAPGPPSAAPSDRNKKSSSGIASTLGLKKFFLALGQGTRPKLGKSRSYSVEQLQPPAPGPASHTSTPKVKRAPSLQSLRVVSPSHQHRKAASFQNLHSLLSGKVDRSSLYLVGEPGAHSTAGRPAKAPPRRALSIEDVGAPSLARTVGRVVEVFPDGTSQLQLQRSPEGTFGFCVASGNGRRDSGFYVQEMADESTAKLYSGLLGLGDEILEVNGAKVAGLGLAHIQELLAHAESLSIRVLRQRPVPR